MSDVQASTPQASASGGRAPIQIATMFVALAFLLVGLLGFVPGITTDFNSMTFAGHHSSAELFGVFEVSVLHNIVHLLFGIAGFLLARSVRGSWMYLMFGGAIYLVLWLYGLLIDLDSAANFVPVNNADNWLHFGLGVGMIGLGAVLGRGTKR